MFPGAQVSAQANLDSLWAVWKDESQPDTLRLRALSEFAWNGYLFSQPDSAFYYGQVMYDHAKRLGLRKQMAYAVRGQGVSFKVRDENAKALEYFLRSLNMSQDINDLAGVAGSLNNIGLLYYELGDLPLALDYHERSLLLREECGDVKGMAGSLCNLGKVYEQMGRPDVAMDHYLRSLKIKEELHFTQGISSVLADIGRLHLQQGDLDKAYDHFTRSAALAEQVDDRLGLAAAFNGMGGVQLQRNAYGKAIAACTKALEHAEHLCNIVEQKRACDGLFIAYKALGMESKALHYLERAASLDQSLHLEEMTKSLQRVEFEKEQQVVCALQGEEKRQVQEAYLAQVAAKNRTKNFYLMAGLFAAMVALGLWSRLSYIRRSKRSLEREKERSDKLLLNILPAQIAQELKDTGEAEPRNYEDVSILFTDFKEFTQTSERMQPRELVDELNACFEAFDRICVQFDIEKIKTIGDAYMAAGGLHTTPSCSARNTVLAALEMQAFMARHKKERTARGLPAFEMRVGIHTGPVVAGIVGIRKFQYDLWGDTVNTASRMETHGAVGEVNISEATYARVKAAEGLMFTPRGKVMAKGKGEMEMYFVRAHSMAIVAPKPCPEPKATNDIQEALIIRA